MISAYIRRNSPPIAIIASRPSADAGLLALAPNRFKDFWREWMPSMFATAAWILAWRLGLVH
jgi:hypothetical protein